MWGFYVDPEYQGRNRGRKLLEAFLKEVRENENLKSVRLMVSEPCETAIQLFKKAGFVQYGLEPMSISDGTHFYNQVYMQIFC